MKCIFCFRSRKFTTQDCRNRERKAKAIFDKHSTNTKSIGIQQKSTQLQNLVSGENDGESDGEGISNATDDSIMEESNKHTDNSTKNTTSNATIECIRRKLTATGLRATKTTANTTLGGKLFRFYTKIR